MSKATGDAELYVQMFGETTRGTRTNNDLAQAAAALGPIISSLILESSFEPDVLSEKGLRQILGRIFDALYPPLS
jgi:hypothetical protein